MTEVIRVDPDHPDPALLAPAAARLRGGGLVAFPTETVYGLGVHALDRIAVTRVFAVKERPANDPLIVHVDSLASAERLVRLVPESARLLAARFWPGPLTLVLPRAAIVPDEVTAGLPTVAIRVPAHPVAHALIALAGVPVAAPSANLFSRPSPTTAAHVLEDLDGRIDLVIDGGRTAIGVESTVVDLTAEVPVVLRPGAVTIEMLREILPQVQSLPSAGTRMAGTAGPMTSPGLLEKHYAPQAPLTLFEGPRESTLRSLEAAAREALERGQVVGLIASQDDRAALEDLASTGRRVLLTTVGSGGRPDEAAAALYGALRDLDTAGVDVIFARGVVEDSGLGTAVLDRLRRAASGRVIRV